MPKVSQKLDKQVKTNIGLRAAHELLGRRGPRGLRRGVPGGPDGRGDRVRRGLLEAQGRVHVQVHCYVYSNSKLERFFLT